MKNLGYGEGGTILDNSIVDYVGGYSSTFIGFGTFQKTILCCRTIFREMLNCEGRILHPPYTLINQKFLRTKDAACYANVELPILLLQARCEISRDL